jgi:hypothetical protein
MTKTTKTDKALPAELVVGLLVRLKPGNADSGSYVLMSATPAPDGSLSLYGGDVDPNGHRRYRAVMPERLQIEDRREVLAKRKRQEQ